MEHLLINIIYLISINLILIIPGYFIIQRKLILVSWLMLVVSVLAIHFIFLNAHPILRMLTIIATTFTGMKVVAATQSNKKTPLPISFKQWLVYAAGWAGMRVQPFQTLGSAPLPHAWAMIRFGISRIIAGFVIIWLAHQIMRFNLPHGLAYTLLSVLLLIGFSLILHFGLLSISAGAWRLHGVNTYLLFKQPAQALSLTEFWSKRWNIAFSEMTSIAIFRPVKNKSGSPIALMLAFAFSGLLHEMALTVPVSSGYGLPLLYFILQGALVLSEKLMSNHHITFLQNKVIARTWLFFWLVVPAPLLFHTQFIKQILFPLAGIKI
ncbi:membrane bound O-acyl transferase family-domain-containing protein [Mucilaginibacter sp. HMF5004]|uniref:MBOAT family protein n=1 Tax=Mucilaginibacter rivuli TaxID=2857527 RepID=UPI001C603C3E|nr:MBOAT family protein [Mucilaginibacter rivuli]MBW4889399.1 membrane bound O-acyl transferase family-domain-containing protein [Mucilaginibacter rivuli]